MTWTTGDTITADKLPAGVVYESASQSVANGDEVGIIWTPVYDPASWLHGDANKVVVPTDGLYLCTFMTRITTTAATGARFRFRIVASGGVVLATHDKQATYTTPSATIAGAAYLDAGDEISATVYQNGGATETWASRFTVMRIAP